MTRLPLLLVFLATTATLGAQETAARARPAANDAQGKWVSLFDGKTLAGWTQRNGTATYRVEDGCVVGKTTKGSPNSFLCTNRDYTDFELTFETKVHNRLNSGVQIRSQTRGSRTGRVNGPQVEIEASGKHGAESGYLYGEAAGGWMTPKKHLIPHKHFKDGEWNAYRVLAVGPNIKTWINGTPISDLTDLKKYRTHPRGFLALQVHGIGRKQGPFEVRWRNIKIREIRNAKAGWTRLFHGGDLSGWTTTGNWTAKDGVLTIAPEKSQRGWQRFGDYLWTDKKYGDFVLDVEYAYNKNGNSGIFFRVDDPKNPVDTGIEAQILDSYKHSKLTPHEHGGVIQTAAPRVNASKPAGSWNRMIILCRGQRLRIDLNGEQIIDVDLSKTSRKDHKRTGHIGLQDHGFPHVVRFRNVWLKELR